MKKTLKRTLAMLLAVIMLVSVLGVASLADAAVEENPYKYYTVLGDSNASGYGLDAYFANAGSTEAVKEGDLIPGSYPAIIADALGCETVDVCSHCAWRTNEFLHMIAPDCGVEWSSFFLRALDFVKSETLIGKGEAIVNAIEKADLISVDFGSNDIYSYAINETYEMHADELEGMLDTLNAISDDPSILLQEMITIADKLGFLKQLIDDFKANLDENTAEYEANMVLVINEIRKINPDAKILVMGVFCPISLDLRINHQVVLDFISSSDKRISSINNYLKNECPVKDEYTFVDVSKTECFGIGALDVQKLLALDENVKYSAVKMVHPNEAGHQYIANQILATMQAEISAPVVSVSSTSLLKKASLKWNDVDGAVSYRIYRIDSDGTYKLAGISLNTSFVDLLAAKNSNYSYAVCAVMNLKGTLVTPMSLPVSLAK